jgi:hypothetical protein
MKKLLLAALLLIAAPAFASGDRHSGPVIGNDGITNAHSSDHNNSALANGGNGYGVGIAGGGDARSNSRAYGGDGGTATGYGNGQATSSVGDTVATSGDSISGSSATGGTVGNTSAIAGTSLAGSGNSTNNIDGTGGAANVDVQGGSNSTSFNSDTRALALSLPPATPGFGASAPCLTTTRGVTVFGAGASGRTEIDSECYQDQQLQLMFKNCMDVTQTYVAMGLMGEARDQMEACRVLALKRTGGTFDHE